MLLVEAVLNCLPEVLELLEHTSPPGSPWRPDQTRQGAPPGARRTGSGANGHGINQAGPPAAHRTSLTPLAGPTRPRAPGRPPPLAARTVGTPPRSSPRACRGPAAGHAPGHRNGASRSPNRPAPTGDALAPSCADPRMRRHPGWPTPRGVGQAVPRQFLRIRQHFRNARGRPAPSGTARAQLVVAAVRPSAGGRRRPRQNRVPPGHLPTGRRSTGQLRSRG
jgi:hypothetical protein